MRELLIIGLAAFIIGCKTVPEVVDVNVSEEIVAVEEVALDEGTSVVDPNIDGKPQRPYQIQGRIGDFSSKASDPFEILSAKVIGNKLFVEVSYSGGCGLHKWECFGNEAISKSLPPQRAIKLIHDNGDDACESIVNQTIEIDINPFAFSLAGRSEIVLLLDGYSQQITYINK